jgi:hypothetical protein
MPRLTSAARPAQLAALSERSAQMAPADDFHDGLNMSMHLVRSSFALVVSLALFLTILLALGSRASLAQSGSAGGSIGNDDKSVSGSREERAPNRSADPAPSRRSKPASDESRSSSRRSGGGGAGGGGGNFDGAWAVMSVGCGGTTSGAVVVSSGRIIGEGVTGTVSAGGAVSTFGQGQGVTFTSSGRLTSRSGSGTFRRSDGCTGTWTSVKQ